MKFILSIFILATTLAAHPGAHAQGSMLRVACEGDAVRAEISINGVFKGECPLDIQVNSGTIQLRAVKKIDASRERVFSDEFRMGEGVVKKVEVTLSAPSLNAEALRREDVRVAAERAQAQTREAERLRVDAEREPERLRVETRNRAEFASALASDALQGSFRDCADCPEMLAIPPGSFEMGSNNGSTDEKPVHRVNISRAFALGKTEVTQAQWRTIMGNNPSNFKNCSDNCPVERVSWDDAQIFIQKLNAKTGKQYRLPSEAEWEYACRAGGKNEYCGSNDLASVAWHKDNSGGQTHTVAGKQANAFGLFDMSGNVYEWVEDSYQDSYAGAPNDGGAWLGDGAKRVLRGGSWSVIPQPARAAYRFRNEPDFRGITVGFRLARMLP